jgi:BirA family transcriptional regulator, biotin operon repressor / biotin---[acetyl-CoA-carboxylase] ligase
MSASDNGLPDPYRLIHLDEVDSTNAEAMRRALAGDRGPLWVLADRQSAGRGRSGRTWASAPGNLFASLLIETRCPLAKAGQLSLVAGVAAIDAVAMAGSPVPGLRLKWPNDILIGAAKVGGILVESSQRGPEQGLQAVIGVGLNLASAPPGLEAGATDLAAHGLALSPHQTLCFLAETMDGWLKTWNEADGIAAVRSGWLQRAGAIGERLSVHGPDGPVVGRFSGLDAAGALIIAADDGTERHFTYGDVTIDAARKNKDDQSR